MSWDVLVQDLPKWIRTTDEIPDDFDPKPLGDRHLVTQKVREALLGLKLDDTGFGCFEGDGFSIEVSVGIDDPTMSVMLSVRGGGMAAGAVASVVAVLGGSALDSGSESGMFDSSAAQQNFAAWQAYRDRLIGGGTA